MKSEHGNTKHGLRDEPIYSTWRGMIRRCYDDAFPKFPRYGGRGITVCEFLRSSPRNLLDLVGEKPSSDHSIGRPNNDGNYSCGTCAECLQSKWPLNVRWESTSEQQRNTSQTRWLTFNGETKPMVEWAERSNVPYHTFKRRVSLGIDPFKRHRK